MRIEILQLCATNSSRRVAEIFNNRHPNRIPRLSYTTVQKLQRKFVETGTVDDRSRTGRPLNPNIQAAVLEAVEANPRLSLRRMALDTNHSTKTVANVLHRNGFHPYKAQMHQRIYDDDDESRMIFCEVLTNWINQDPLLAQRILWTDESLFRLNGNFNRQNNR